MDPGGQKATALRKIELHALYMLDGRFKTLEEVIDFNSYRDNWLPSVSLLIHHVNRSGLQLTPEEK